MSEKTNSHLGNMDINALVEKITSYKKSPVLVAIDGRCGAGKTTLADSLQNASGGNIFRMDDFFLQPHQRTPERYATPGGNVDIERFTSEVLTPLLENRSFSYSPFNCATMEMGAPVLVTPHTINIVEGCYSCLPSLAGFYSYKIFLTVDPAEQMRRILKRNGEEKALQFKEKWIPLEELYFKTFDIEKLCDVVLDNSTVW